MLAPMRRLALAVLLALAAGCGGGSGDDDARPQVVIQTDGGEVEIAVEIADTSEERARGLMGRKSLPENSGMIFVYPEATEGAFWMKNTLIPLSIAFYGSDGTILRILDMEPCRRDPCPLYDPGVAFNGALEVNRGAFERLGVREGDRLELQGIAESAEALTKASSA
jgi:uncharacterized membrane protein (UPF0127 family)